MNVGQNNSVAPLQAQKIWQAAFDQLQRELNRGTFDTWLRGATLLGCEGGTFVIGVPHAYARDWLENRLTSTITRLLTGICNQDIQVEFVVAKESA